MEQTLSKDEQALKEYCKVKDKKEFNVFLCYRDSTAILAKNFYDYVKRINISLYDGRYYGDVYYSDYIACGKYTDYRSLKTLIDSVNYFIIFLDKSFTNGFTIRENGNEILNRNCVTANEIKFLLKRKEKPKIIVININGYNFKDYIVDNTNNEKIMEYIDQKSVIENEIRLKELKLTAIEKGRMKILLDDFDKDAGENNEKYSEDEKEERVKRITNGNNINNFDVRQGDEESFFERILASIDCVDRNEKFYYFGSYPQTRINISKFKNAIPSFNSWTSYEYLYNGVPKKYMRYFDLEENVRLVRFEKYRPCLIAGIPFGYQKENGYSINKTYGFKFEPIKWRMIKTDDQFLYLASADILDSQPYTNLTYSQMLKKRKINSFKKTYIKTWLNKIFYKIAFKKEKKAIVGGVSLLSADDVTHHLTKQKRSRINATDYAKCQGIYSYDSNYEWGLIDAANSNGFDIKFIAGNKFMDIREDLVIYTNGGVIPYIKIDKSKINYNTINGKEYIELKE